MIPTTLVAERWMFSIEKVNKKFLVFLNLEGYTNPFKGERFDSLNDADRVIHKAMRGGKLLLKQTA